VLAVFGHLADWLVYDCLQMPPGDKLAQALHFFVEDTTKIFALLVLMIYLVALARASLDIERVRYYLSRRRRSVGYVLGSAFGAITPFCSCSSIPVFLGFTSAGIPVGITMAFLLTSPLINEVAILLLVSLLGWQFTVLYVVVGMAVGILGGLFLDTIRAERLLADFATKAYVNASGKLPEIEPHESSKISWHERHDFALSEARDILGRVWKWVFIGVGLGAGLHGFVPAGWLENNLGNGQWWSVPAAVLMGIPLYSNATGVIPVMESLLGKGLPVGTTLAFCMSTVAASFPEFILLKQVMQWRLLALLFVMLLLAFTVVGWVLNAFPM
jgi:uncharacterized membrane protein YraQ (UPF0718 family)